MSARQRPRGSGGPNLLALITVTAAVGFIVLLVVLVMQLLDGGSSGSGPRLAVDRERIDFGRVVYDQSVRAVFTVKNDGDKPLQIAERQIVTKVVEGC